MNMLNWFVTSLWDKLAEEKRPIFLYGTGNGGDKIVDVCHSRHISLTGVFASDGFVRHRTFRDMPVESYGDVIQKYGEDIVILLAFGTTRPEVYRFLEQLDARHTLYIPEVPLYGGALFDTALLQSNLASLEAVYSLLGDEHSRRLFDDTVLFRLTGQRKYLLRTTDPTQDISTLLGDKKIRTMLDGGAFRGDSASIYSAALPSLTTIYAAEADARTYGHLCTYAENEKRTQVVPLHCALWDSDGEMQYTASASRGSGITGQNHRAKTITVPTRTIDSICTQTVPDLIKLDLEGAEAKAIAGGLSIIRNCQPAMAVSLYHRTEDLWELPLLLHELLPHHTLFLRRPLCIPCWDLTLFLV